MVDMDKLSNERGEIRNGTVRSRDNSRLPDCMPITISPGKKA